MVWLYESLQQQKCVHHKRTADICPAINKLTLLVFGFGLLQTGGWGRWDSCRQLGKAWFSATVSARSSSNFINVCYLLSLLVRVINQLLARLSHWTTKDLPTITAQQQKNCKQPKIANWTWQVKMRIKTHSLQIDWNTASFFLYNKVRSKRLTDVQNDLAMTLPADWLISWQGANPVWQDMAPTLRKKAPHLSMHSSECVL